MERTISRVSPQNSIEPVSNSVFWSTCFCILHGLLNKPIWLKCYLNFRLGKVCAPTNTICLVHLSDGWLSIKEEKLFLYLFVNPKIINFNKRRSELLNYTYLKFVQYSKHTVYVGVGSQTGKTSLL